MTSSWKEKRAAAKALHGQKFNRLTAVELVESPNKGSTWKCKCDCGRYTNVNATQLTRGAVKSCGCLRADFVRSIATKHSDCRPGHYTSEWYAWSSMRQRCINPKHAAYRDYGGRGITVCAAWTDSYEAFLADMGRKPTPKHTLDRIDVNAGYSPENCRWATWAVQQRNRRNNHMVEYRGKTMCVTDFATAIGMPASRVFARLRHGSDPESIAAAWLQVSPAEPAPTQEQPK